MYAGLRKIHTELAGQILFTEFVKLVSERERFGWDLWGGDGRWGKKILGYYQKVLPSCRREVGTPSLVIRTFTRGEKLHFFLTNTTTYIRTQHTHARTHTKLALS